MASLSAQLLRSLRITHVAAVHERRMLVEPALDLIVYRDQIAEMHAEARRLAGAFAVYADFFAAANDEPPFPEQA